MRAVSIVFVVWTSVIALAGAQTPGHPSSNDQQKIQEATDRLGLDRAEQLARNAQTALGSVSDETNRSILRWGAAVVDWKRESHSRSAAALLSEGVLFDCLSRLHGIRTAAVRGLEKNVAPLYYPDLAGERPGRAAKAFEAALEIDASLIEARFRASRIRASANAAAADVLETLATNGAVAPFAYLAAMARAETARRAGHRDEAIRWYERAVSINGGSTAAAIALNGLHPVGPLDYRPLDRSDIYYAYPCEVLTPEVHTELSARIQRTAAGR